MNRTALFFTETPKVVEIRDQHLDVPEGWLTGKTLYSLVSSGTEINGSYLNVFHWPRPANSGYSAVFRADAPAGDFKAGDLIFVYGNHASRQLSPVEDALKVPDGLPAEKAVFARMAAVSMASLHRVGVPKGEKLLVTGLGAVGLMAAQSWRCEGYNVVCVEIDPARRENARKLGFAVFATTKEAEDAFGKVKLALECTGVQSVAADAADMLEDHGEMSLVGVPWKKTDSTDAFRFMNTIFYSYLKVYSGWEMDLTRGERMDDCRRALERLASGEISVDGLYTVRPWQEAQAVYDGIYDRSIPQMSVLFNWQ